MTPSFYDDVRDRLRHEDTIRRLAAKEGVPVEYVQRMYETVLEELKGVACVKDFLPILIARRTQQLILQARRLHATG